MYKRIYLSPPHMCGKELEYVIEAFNSNWVAPLGPNVDEFEKEVASYIGTKGAVALSSGTAGIHLSLRALGVNQGDYVICSSLTFIGSCNPILYEKAIPVFVDSEKASWNMCPKMLEKAIEELRKRGISPKAVIVVNLYGQSADYDQIIPICKKYDIPVIEDAAESIGAKYKGKCAGALAEIGTFSFNGNKIITTSGGGMVVSENEDYLKRIKFLATQARERELHYEHKEMGYNYRMSNIVAGIGRGQLSILNNRIESKKQIFNKYREAFKDIPSIEMMPIAEFGEPNYWLSVITLDIGSGIDPLEIIHELEENNIESRPVWKPMHLQPIFSGYEYFMDTKDVSKELYETGICLPSGTGLSEEDIHRVISVVRNCITKKQGNKY